MTDSQYPPNSTAFNNRAPASNHPGGVNAAMTDGSVRFIKNTISSGAASGNIITNPGVFQAISTRNMGEVIDANSY
jgi:prepilin-type processing-associated H-X9-DG protein